MIDKNCLEIQDNKAEEKDEYCVLYNFDDYIVLEVSVDKDTPMEEVIEKVKKELQPQVSDLLKDWDHRSELTIYKKLGVLALKVTVEVESEYT